MNNINSISDYTGSPPATPNLTNMNSVPSMMGGKRIRKKKNRKRGGSQEPNDNRSKVTPILDDDDSYAIDVASNDEYDDLDLDNISEGQDTTTNTVNQIAPSSVNEIPSINQNQITSVSIPNLTNNNSDVTLDTAERGESPFEMDEYSLAESGMLPKFGIPPKPSGGSRKRKNRKNKGTKKNKRNKKTKKIRRSRKIKRKSRK
jgi:hypothetical protein